MLLNIWRAVDLPVTATRAARLAYHGCGVALVACAVVAVLA